MYGEKHQIAVNTSSVDSFSAQKCFLAFTGRSILSKIVDKEKAKTDSLYLPTCTTAVLFLFTPSQTPTRLSHTVISGKVELDHVALADQVLRQALAARLLHQGGPVAVLYGQVVVGTRRIEGIPLYFECCEVQRYFRSLFNFDGVRLVFKIVRILIGEVW